MNYRISAFQAALGRSQLSRTAGNLIRRREIAEWYDKHLQGSGCTLPPLDPGHAWHLYVIRHPRRRQLYEYLRTRKIFTQVHYVPLHHHTYYQDSAKISGSLPQADRYYEQCLSLPMYPELTEADLCRVRDELLAFEEDL